MAVKTNYQKNGSNYYRVTATIGKDASGKVMRKEFYGKSKKEAEAKRDEYMQSIRSGLAADYREQTLGDLMHLWLFEVVKPTKAENTLVRYLNVYDNYIKPSELFNSKIYAVVNMDIQRIYNKLAAEGKTPSMLYNMNKVLKVFFNYCIKQRYILINPCIGIEFPKIEKSAEKQPKIDPFTDEEIKTILNNAPDYMFPLTATAFATGLREGELLALKLSDVDFEKEIIKVTKSLKTTYNCKPDGTRERVIKLGDTKTKSSIRDVPIPHKLIPVLKQHITQQRLIFFKFNIPAEEQLLFTTSTGCYIDAHNLQRRWMRLLKKIGARYRKFHNARHTYATKLFEANVNIKTIQILLGHSSLQTTSQIYIHVMQDVKADAVNKINYLLG